MISTGCRLADSHVCLVVFQGSLQSLKLAPAAEGKTPAK